VKDLRARSNILLVFLAVAALLGCQSLNATKPASQQNSAELTSAVSHLEFGSVVIGYKQTLANEIVNNSNSAVTLTAARVDQPDFSLSAKQLPLTLAPGETAALTVNYQPKAHGTSTGTVTLADASTTSSTSFSVSGTATSAGKLSVAPSTISFGTVGVGQNQKVSASVTNTGGSDVTITQASISGNGFSLSGLTLPITLHPSSSVPFTVVFAPASGGPVNGSISLVGSVAVVTKKGKGHRTPVTTDTVSTTQTVPCSGTGMMTGQLNMAEFESVYFDFNANFEFDSIPLNDGCTTSILSAGFSTPIVQLP